MLHLSSQFHSPPSAQYIVLLPFVVALVNASVHHRGRRYDWNFRNWLKSVSLPDSACGMSSIPSPLACDVPVSPKGMFELFFSATCQHRTVNTNNRVSKNFRLFPVLKTLRVKKLGLVFQKYSTMACWENKNEAPRDQNLKLSGDKPSDSCTGFPFPREGTFCTLWYEPNSLAEKPERWTQLAVGYSRSTHITYFITRRPTLPFSQLLGFVSHLGYTLPHQHSECIFVCEIETT